MRRLNTCFRQTVRQFRLNTCFCCLNTCFGRFTTYLIVSRDAFKRFPTYLTLFSMNNDLWSMFWSMLRPLEHVATSGACSGCFLGPTNTAVTTVTVSTPVSTPVFLSQHLVSQHLFWCLNSCPLRQICVSTLNRKPCADVGRGGHPAEPADINVEVHTNLPQ